MQHGLSTNNLLQHRIRQHKLCTSSPKPGGSRPHRHRPCRISKGHVRHTKQLTTTKPRPFSTKRHELHPRLHHHPTISTTPYKTTRVRGRHIVLQTTKNVPCRLAQKQIGQLGLRIQQSNAITLDVPLHAALRTTSTCIVTRTR